MDMLLYCEQGGFRKGLGTHESCFVLREVIMKANLEGNPLYVAVIDFKKAFDTVDFDKLLCKLWFLGIKGRFWLLLKFSLKTGNSVLQNHGENILIKILSGVRQGGKSSPLLWNIYINDLIDCLNDSKHSPFVLFEIFLRVLLYADDCTLVATSPEALQDLFDKLEKFANEWGLSFSTTKCKVLVPSNPLNLQSSFTLCGEPLDQVDHCTFLGLDLELSGTNFSGYALKLCETAKKRTAVVYDFLESSQFSSFSDAVLLYKSLIRPLLETNAQVTRYKK